MDPNHPQAVRGPVRAGRVFPVPFLALAAVASGFALPGAARAETYHTCAGFIDTLPATISTQGVWCLKKDLATAITTGQAITVATNNVTIDCNGFKLGGLAAGASTVANGIYADARLNVTVRNCNVRGFGYGISLVGNGGGHRVEGNRLDGNTLMGIQVDGDGSTIVGNQVFDTGWSIQSFTAYGIYTNASVNVRDNDVAGVEPTATGNGDAWAYGIFTYSNNVGVIAGNRVNGVVGQGGGETGGIFNFASDRVMVLDNVVTVSTTSTDIGIRCTNNVLGRARGNIVSGFAIPNEGCVDLGNDF